MDMVYDLLQRISKEQLRRNLFYLTKNPIPFRKLNYTVPGHKQNTLYEADDCIEMQLRSWGYDVEREACEVQAFSFDRTKPKHRAWGSPPADAPFYTAYNLYAKKTGQDCPDEIILLLAHKDSQSWIDSPGAYDNCVGTIAVLEIARVLADYSSKRSIRFLFCNEEHTPWTSIIAARNYRLRGENLISLFNLDALGGKSDEDIASEKKTNVTLYTTPEGKSLADLMAHVNEVYHIGLIQTCAQQPEPSDDDGSFIKEGYTYAVANIGSYPYADSQYHLEGDIPERVDILNVRMSAQATLAAVLWLDRELWQ